MHMPNEINILNVNSIASTGLVNIWHTNGIAGNPLQARVNAFRIGTAPYVSFADPDDLVEPTAFQQCLDYLEGASSLDAVYTNSIIFDVKRKEARPFFKNHFWNWRWHRATQIPVHQLVVIKRSALMPILKLYDGKVQRSRAEQLFYDHFEWKFLPTIGYYWYKRPTGNHTKPIHAHGTLR